jgi:lipopolysaccharide/colanic/teichoic acid biosynthesis glycosyltransferase
MSKLLKETRQSETIKTNSETEFCSLDSHSDKRSYLIAKRILDIVFACVGIILLIVPMGIVSILIKLESPGPVFYLHHRIGKNGKDLPLLKFRSMYINADEMIKNFTPEQKVEWEENFKLEHDPRVTRVGKFLRKSSIDELPQLINILKGELSIVGERGIIETTKKNIGFSRVVAVNSIS